MSQSIRIGSLIRHLGAWRSTARSRAAYVELADAIRLLILDGRLALGVRLPGERDLAQGLGLSRTTITAAYAQLRDAGYVQSRQGSGVRTALPASDAGSVKMDDSDTDTQILIDLSSAATPASPNIHRAYSSALQQLPAHLPAPGYDRVGLERLRSAIANRYSARGLDTAPDQIIVTGGALHGLTLLLRGFTGPGDQVVIDHPTYPHAIDAIQRAYCRVIPVSLPASGWDVEGLAAAFRQSAPRLAYLVPDFHNPTGRCMDATTRRDVAASAAETRTMLVFDEALTDLGIECAAPVPDPVTEAQVVRLGSMGKSFWGGLRIGWIRAERSIISSLATARTSIDLGTPILEQLAAAALLDETQDWSERRAIVRQQRDALVGFMTAQLPEWKLEMPAGGLSVWAELPEAISTGIAATARRYGLSVAAGPRFGVNGAFERFMRLPYTQPGEVLEQAVNRLARTFEAIRSSAKISSGDPAVI